MVKVAKLASRLNWRRTPDADRMPRFFLFTDQERLPDPSDLLERLPRGAAVVLRHTDPAQLDALAQRVTPRAQALGLKVLLAGEVRAALKHRCDGVHLSQTRARRGPGRITGLPPGFLVTAAAHDGASLRHAANAGADAVMLSPVFPTESHPRTPAFGALRFARLCAVSERPVIALGGITPGRTKRLNLGSAYGLAAIGAWRD